MDTPDQKAADKIGRAIDGQILRLQQEDEALAQAMARRAEITQELVVLQAEKARIDPRRPVRAPSGVSSTLLKENPRV